MDNCPDMGYANAGFVGPTAVLPSMGVDSARHLQREPLANGLSPNRSGGTDCGTD